MPQCSPLKNLLSHTTSGFPYFDKMNFAPDQNTAEMGLGTMPASRSPRNPACGGSSDSDLSSAAENNSLPSEKGQGACCRIDRPLLTTRGYLVIDPDEFMFANCRYYDNSL